MSEEETKESTEESASPRIEFHVSPELEYVYRDIFNVYAGVGDVTIEFGNLHKSMPGHASISNRIVISTSNAYILMQTLQDTMQKAQAALQHNLARQKE